MKGAYPIPEAALDDRLAWLGTSGSGKTYNAGGGVERLLSSGARCVIVDPRAKLTGPQWRVLEPVIGAYPKPITSQEVAEATGYSAGSGGFANLRGSLRTIGLIDYPSPGQVRAADWLFPN